MVSISLDRDGNGFRAYLLPTHPVKASHPLGWIYNPILTTAHPWCDTHFTSISAYGVWGIRAGVQVFRTEFSHIYTLRLIRLE